MCAAAAVLANIGSDQVNAKVYGSLSSAARLLLNVKTRGQIIWFSAQLWQLNSRVQDLIEQITDISEGKFTASQATTQEHPTLASADVAISNLEHLSRILAYIYEQARRRGFMNNSIISGSLSRMNKNAEQLLDFADYLHILVQHDGVSDIFRRADEEKAHGELFSIS